MTDEDQSGEGPEPGQNNPASEAMSFWERLIEDMEATAAEYREQGWSAVEIHPGDVSTFSGEQDRRGFELLPPDDEFNNAAAAFDECDGFEAGEVYRAVEGGVVYVLVVLEAPETKTALLLPAYYNHGQETDFVEMLESTDSVPIHVRPLDERRVLTFTYNEPSLFLPE